jgi:Protein of unknown function (DUF3307)
VPWPEIFLVFLVSHFAGDFLLQTEFQATGKHGGLGGGDPVARRALAMHVLTYTAAFVPAYVWLADSLGPGVLAVALLVSGPHLIQDDGRLVDRYMEAVKHVHPGDQPGLKIMVDQVLHMVALFLVAILAAT